MQHRRLTVHGRSSGGHRASLHATHASPHAVLIRVHNCALCEIAQQFPEVCSAEAAFIEDVLGTAIERRSHMMHGCTSCEYTTHERNDQ